MSENIPKSSYAITPCFILDDDTLDEGAKNLYARISMYSQEGRCWASNKHFSEKHKVEIRTIQRWLNQLKEAGYISVEIDSSGFQTTRDIWIIVDFKKSFTKRHVCHPPMHLNAPPPASEVMTYMNINTSDINIKQQQAAVVPLKKTPQAKIYECLKNMPLEEEFKIKLTKEWKEDKLKGAVEWAFHRDNPPKKSFEASITYALQHALSLKDLEKIKETPYEKVLKLFKNGEKYNGAECYLTHEHIAFERGMKNEYIKLDNFFSMSQLYDLCKSFQIEIP